LRLVVFRFRTYVHPSTRLCRPFATAITPAKPESSLQANEWE
jgi:hypothetical protein